MVLTRRAKPGECPRYVFIIRHGETLENHIGIHQGQAVGGRLSQRGIDDARMLGWRLGSIAFDGFHVSPASRCQETARILRGYISAPDIQTDMRLNAKNSGYLAGRPRGLGAEEAARLGVPIHQFRPPGGESSEDLQARYVELWRDVCKGPSRRVLLLGHGGGIACLLLHLTQRSFTDYLAYVPGSAGITVVRLLGGARGEIVLTNVAPGDLGPACQFAQ